MNPFLEIPVKLQSAPGKINRLSRLLGRKPEHITRVATGRILPGEIAMHYPDGNSGTVVILKGGQSFITSWTAETLDHARQEYTQFVSAYPKNRGNIQLTPNAPAVPDAPKPMKAVK